MPESGYDLCIVTDDTGSMSSFLEALVYSMHEFTPLFKICSNFERIGVLAYGDYSETVVTRWSGWKQAADELKSFADGLRANGGGDTPEAAKTAVWELSKVVERKTLIIWYTDAPPHTDFSPSDESHISAEKKYLGENFDWITLTELMVSVNATVWFVLSDGNEGKMQELYTHMSQRTGGKTLLLNKTTTEVISKTTVGIVLSLMGHRCDFSGILECSLESHDYKNEKDLSVAKLNTIPFAMQVESTESSSDEALLQLTKNFEHDPEFKTKVYEVFSEVLKPGLIRSLTYNPVFGRLWRLICRDQNDTRQASTMNTMSAVIGSLTGPSKEILQAFIMESYRQEDVVKRKLESAAAKYPAVIFTGDSTGVTPQEIMELTWSCSPSSLQKLSQYIRLLEIVDPSQENACDKNSQVDNSRASIPLALSDLDVFSCLAHLFCSGLTFALRPAIVFAMLNVYVPTSVLASRASEFLLHNVGKWIKCDQAENFSFEFVKFLLSVDAKLPILTDEERAMFTKLRSVGSLRLNRDTNVRICVPFVSIKTMRKDDKKECVRCREWRSFTLINEDGVCGICLICPPKQYVSESAVLSCMCECKSCNAHYAVEDVAALKAQPKCHFCRYEKRVAPYVRCVTCRNKYVSANEALNTRSDWVCAVCRDISETPPPPQEYAIPMRKYFDDGHVLRSIFDAKSLWVIYDAVMQRDVQVPELHYQVDYMGKPILNIPEIETSVKRWLESGRAEREACSMCFQEKSKTLLYNVCDKKRCNARACQDCRVAWYGQLQPGHIAMKAWLCCPYCRSFVGLKTLRGVNPGISQLKKIPETWDASWRYAWCRRCFGIEQYQEQECAADPTVAEVTRFLCANCQENNHLTTVRHCPSCDVAVEKIDGCNHISCQCGTHWCFLCAKTATQDEIYQHLNEVHGGIGIEDNNED